MAAIRPTQSLLRNKAWLGGAWTSAINGGTFPVFNPSTGEKIEDVPDMNEDDVEIAIREAYRAQKTWGTTIAKNRSGILKKFFDLVMSNQEELAVLTSMEVGKPLQESRGEVLYGASYLEWYAEEAKRICGDIIAPPSKEKRILIAKQPVGVAAMITPWNFPLALVLRKVSAGLAAGCTCVVKPSEETPLVALALAELSQQANLPPGVLNVVTSSQHNVSSVGKRLCSSDLVRKLSFTGSTGVGKLLMSQCSETVKHLSLELGGNAPLVVFNSADIDVAIRGTMLTKFRNGGQACISSNRVLVQSGIYEKFVSALHVAVSKLKIGDAFTRGVNLGPLINKAAINKVEGYVSDAVSEGAEIVIGGRREETLGELFYNASVLTGVTTNMKLAREEIFGPVIPIIKFEEEEDAIKMANDTPYGLASYFFTTDMSQMWRVSEAMESGMVGVNEGIISSELIPFGGIKESGFGREGSKYGIDEYLEKKYICIGGVVEQK